MATEMTAARPPPPPHNPALGLRMSLPTNYRQVAMMGPTPTPGPTHVYMPASPLMSNILKERLGRSGGAGASSKVVGEVNVPSPFSTPLHGNPAFNPQKMGPGKAGQGGEGRIPKPPKAPDKPLMPYMRYSRKVWDQVKAANTELKLWEIGKIIGSMWRDLPEADKQDFVDEYESEKLEYEKAMKTYHASPSYQAYLSAKTKGSATTEEKEVEDRTTRTLAPSTKFDRRIDIQPAEDDDSQYHDDGVSVKQVSHIRYARNHRLTNEIFSENLVPDVRSVVTTQRLSVLRRQVQSLTMHQKKLETELQQIEEKFEAKKRKFVEAGDSFHGELKKVKATAPKLDHASFLAMVERQKEVVRREAEERQRTAQGLPPRPPSTSSPQVTPAGTTTAAREEGGESTGPAPQNTAIPVDAPSPAPPQENSDSGGDTEGRGEVTTVTTTPATVTTAVTTTTTSDTLATTTTLTTPAVINGPTTSASSSPVPPPHPAPPTVSQEASSPNPTPTLSQAAHFSQMTPTHVVASPQPPGTNVAPSNLISLPHPSSALPLGPAPGGPVPQQPPLAPSMMPVMGSAPHMISAPIPAQEPGLAPPPGLAPTPGSVVPPQLPPTPYPAPASQP